MYLSAFHFPECDPLPEEVEKYMNPNEVSELLGQVWLVSNNIFVINGCDVTYNSGNYDSPISVGLKPYNSVLGDQEFSYNVLKKEGKFLCNSVNDLPKVGETYVHYKDPSFWFKVVDVSGNGVDYITDDVALNGTFPLVDIMLPFREGIFVKKEPNLEDLMTKTTPHINFENMKTNPHSGTKLEDFGIKPMLGKDSKMTPQYRILGKVHVGDVWQIDFGEPSGKKLVVIDKIDTDCSDDYYYCGHNLIGDPTPCCMTDTAMKNPDRSMLIATSVDDLPKVGEIWSCGKDYPENKVVSITDTGISFDGFICEIHWNQIIGFNWNKVEPWPDNGPCKIDGDVKISKDGHAKFVPKRVMVSVDGKPGEWVDLTGELDIINNHCSDLQKSTIELVPNPYEHTVTYGFEFPDGRSVIMPDPGDVWKLESQELVSKEELWTQPPFKVSYKTDDDNGDFCGIIHNSGKCWMYDWWQRLEDERAKIVSCIAWKKELVEFEEKHQEHWEYLDRYPLMNGIIK